MENSGDLLCEYYSNGICTMNAIITGPFSNDIDCSNCKECDGCMGEQGG